MNSISENDHKESLKMNSDLNRISNIQSKQFENNESVRTEKVDNIISTSTNTNRKQVIVNLSDSDEDNDINIQVINSRQSSPIIQVFNYKGNGVDSVSVEEEETEDDSSSYSSSYSQDDIEIIISLDQDNQMKSTEISYNQQNVSINRQSIEKSLNQEKINIDISVDSNESEEKADNEHSIKQNNPIDKTNSNSIETTSNSNDVKFIDLTEEPENDTHFTNLNENSNEINNIQNNLNENKNIESSINIIENSNHVVTVDIEDNKLNDNRNENSKVKNNSIQQEINQLSTDILTLSSNILNFENNIEKEKIKIIGLNQKKLELNSLLNEEIEYLKNSELPIDYSTIIGLGFNVFDELCTDFIACTSNILVRFQSLINIFLESDNEYSSCLYLNGIVSNIIGNLINQFWGKYYSKFAIDSQPISFLYRYFILSKKNFNRRDVISFLEIILNELFLENYIPKNLFEIQSSVKNIKCNRCGYFDLASRNSVLNLELLDPDLMHPIDVVVLNEMDVYMTIFTFSIEEIITGVEWKRTIIKEFEKEMNSELNWLFLHKQTITNEGNTNIQFIQLKEDETLNSEKIDKRSPILFAWASKKTTTADDFDQLELDSEKALSNRSIDFFTPPQNFDFIIVNILGENYELFQPIFVKAIRSDQFFIIDKKHFVESILSNLYPFQKRNINLVDIWKEIKNSFKNFLALFDIIFYNGTIKISKEDLDRKLYSDNPKENNPILKLIENEPQDLHHIFVPFKNSDELTLSSIQLQVSNIFYSIFDINLLIDYQKRAKYNFSFQSVRQNFKDYSDSLDLALKRHFSKFICPDCFLDCDTINYHINSPPENLILKLNRFEPQYSIKNTKSIYDYNNILVWIPIGFDLREYVSVESENFEYYEIKTIVYHDGPLESGIWSVYSKNDQSNITKWYRLQAQSIDPANIFNAIYNNNIFALVYEKLPNPSIDEIVIVIRIEKFNLGGCTIYLKKDHTIETLKNESAKKLNFPHLKTNYDCIIPNINLSDSTTIEDILSMNKFKILNNNIKRVDITFIERVNHQVNHES